jgi:hypothetical protein
MNKSLWVHPLDANGVRHLQSDFKAAVQVAVPLAQSHLAKGIPGFKGK